MTLATVRLNTKRIREFSALPFLLVAAVSVVGALYQPAPQAVTGGPINAGDTAWMLSPNARLNPTAIHRRLTTPIVAKLCSIVETTFFVRTMPP